MGKNILAVCDVDASYARNFTEYQNEKNRTPFEVQAFTNVESLEKFARDNEIDILLISTRAMCNEIGNLPIGRTIILSEGEQPANQGYPLINKYQSSDDIISEVMEYFVQDHPQPNIMALGARKPS
ncbi:MAG: hypothetical protein LUF30_09145, partial [Lachnospiraceae bacterium]|nr:hypothetical protein [Lachnospiraceae bacterium]